MDDTVDYALRIVGTNPNAIPMARLADYMAEFAKFLGSTDSVHFSRLEDRSVSIVAYAPSTCVATISPRIRQASKGDAESAAYSPWRRINEFLAEDGWKAELPLPNSSETIEFPGITKANKIIRSVTQPTAVQGRLIRIEGAGDLIHIGLDIEGDLSARISVNAHLAADLVSSWHRYIRISGEGKWKRDDKGQWFLDRLYGTAFEVLDDASVADVLDRLRKFVPSGSGAQIISAVDELRSA